MVVKTLRAYIRDTELHSVYIVCYIRYIGGTESERGGDRNGADELAKRRNANEV